jgi:hypothetical protein
VTAGVRECARCHQVRSTALFTPRARVCDLCKADEYVVRTELNEAGWQAQVLDLAAALGWKHLHVRRSRGFRKGQPGAHTTATNRKGWPDLLLWNPRRGGVVALELKVGKNQPTDEQLEVLGELAMAGVPAMVAYPTDLEHVKALLTTTGKPPSRVSTWAAARKGATIPPTTHHPGGTR